MKNIRGLKSGLKEYIKENRKQSAIKIILSRPFTVWPAFSILYRMNYSREWQDKLNLHNGLRQKTDWKTAIAEKYVDLNNSKAVNLIFLNNPVWIEIHEMCGRDPFRKIKAVSKYNVYFDGTYKDLSESFALGRIHGWDYAVDGHTLDLNRARWQDGNQEKLIEFLKLYTDAFIPPVPKGILKIPTII